jgi:rRNA maturation RNase YbeY
MLDFVVHFEGLEPIKFNEPELLSTYDKIANDHNLVVGAISLVFCSEEYITSVNADFLNHDYATDIITFDYCSNGVLSGDLLVCPSVVHQNAIDFGVSYGNELSRVCLHGFLHLVGYGDKLPEEIEVMRSKEDFYLSNNSYFND